MNKPTVKIYNNNSNTMSIIINNSVIYKHVVQVAPSMSSPQLIVATVKHVTHLPTCFGYLVDKKFNVSSMGRITVMPAVLCMQTIYIYCEILKSSFQSFAPFGIYYCAKDFAKRKLHFAIQIYVHKFMDVNSWNGELNVLLISKHFATLNNLDDGESV